MATPESKVKKDIAKFLKGIGAWYFLPVSNGLGRHGVPDIIVCHKGFFYALEVKAEGKRNHKDRGATPLQMIQINEIKAAGGVAAVVDCVEEVREMICS